MTSLFKSAGMLILMGYSAFNMLNILYFHKAISTVFLPISVAAIYAVYRAMLVFQKNSPISQGELIGICLVFAVTCTVLAQNIFLNSFVGQDGVNTVDNVAALTVTSLMWFFVGAGCARFQFEDSAVVALVVAVMVVAAMVFAIDETLTIPYRLIKEEAGVEGVSHLKLERPVILLLVFAYAMSSKTRPITILLGCIAFFFMGGRTALFTFALTSFLMTFKGNLLRNTIVTGLTAISCVTLFWYSIFAGFIDPEAKAIREILFLDGIEEDGSYQARMTFLTESMPFLADQFWIGNFGLVSEKQGGTSGYVHNILSAWQFYGFFIFLLLLLCLWYSLRKMVYAMKRTDRPADLFGAFLLIYVLISVLVSKYVGWTLLWFVLGYWLMRPSSAGRSSSRKKRRGVKRQNKGKYADISLGSGG